MSCTDTAQECYSAMMLAKVADLERQNAELRKLSVTNILLKVVPGDGDGEELYAKSVADVESELGQLASECEDYELGIKHQPQLVIAQSRIAELQAEIKALKAEREEREKQEPFVWVLDSSRDELPLMRDCAASGKRLPHDIQEAYLSSVLACDGVSLPLYALPPIAPALPEKQPWPNHNWCVGCDPDNCAGCGTEPLERRKAVSPADEDDAGLKIHDTLWDAREEFQSRIAQLEEALQLLLPKCAYSLGNGKWLAEHEDGTTYQVNEDLATGLSALSQSPSDWAKQRDARIAQLEEALQAMVDDGWLFHGTEGMSEPQQKVFNALTQSPSVWKAKYRDEVLEEAAKVCGSMDNVEGFGVAEEFAEAIRAMKE